MGNDGGSIPTRRELVKSPTRHQTHSQLRNSQTQSSHYHWTYCPLSKRLLSSPVVSDHLGWLYNKDAMIEWLLKGVEAFGDGEEVLKGRGIKSLKDVVSVTFQVSDEPGETHNGNGVATELIQGGGVERKEHWVCPVTRKELGGGVKAVYIVPCGCAFAESALREVVSSAERESSCECLQCGKDYNARDVISINPTSEKDIERMKARMQLLADAGLVHSLKKRSGEKKRKKERDTGLKKLNIEGRAEEKKRSTSSQGSAKSKSPSSDCADSSGIKNATMASLTNKILEHAHETVKRRKVEMSTNVKSLPKNKDTTKGTGGGVSTMRE